MNFSKSSSIVCLQEEDKKGYGKIFSCHGIQLSMECSFSGRRFIRLSVNKRMEMYTVVYP